MDAGAATGVHRSPVALRQVGLSARSVYALLDKDGAESFAEAWDAAVLMGVDATRANVIDRAMKGAWVPVVRRGRIVGMKFRYFDNLAIALLSGRGRDIDELLPGSANPLPAKHNLA